MESFFFMKTAEEHLCMLEMTAETTLEIDPR